MGRCVLPGLGVGVVAGLCCFPKKILIFFFRLQPKKNFSKKKIFQKKIFPRREKFFFWGGVFSPDNSPPTILLFLGLKMGHFRQSPPTTPSPWRSRRTSQGFGAAPDAPPRDVCFVLLPWALLSKKIHKVLHHTQTKKRPPREGRTGAGLPPSRSSGGEMKKLKLVKTSFNVLHGSHHCSPRLCRRS